MKNKTNQSHSRIILIIGPQTMRKDRLSKYLVKRYDALAIEVGRFAREVARSADDSTLPVLHDVDWQEMADYGSTHLIRQLIEAFTNLRAVATDVVVITGIKTAAELAVLQNHFEDDLLVVLAEQGEDGQIYEPDADEYTAPDLLETAVSVDVVITATEVDSAYYQQIEDKIVPHLFPAQTDAQR